MNDIAPEELRNHEISRFMRGEIRPDMHDICLQAADTIERQKARIAELEQWESAVIDAVVVSCIYKKEHDTDPRKAINDLCCWTQQISLDPAVSPEAKALHDRIAELEQQVAATVKHAEWLSRVIDDVALALHGWTTETRQVYVPSMLDQQVAALRADAERLDWLADPNQGIGNVQLPNDCVLDNVHSLRDAIDAARQLDAARAKTE